MALSLKAMISKMKIWKTNKQKQNTKTNEPDCLKILEMKVKIIFNSRQGLCVFYYYRMLLYSVFYYSILLQDSQLAKVWYVHAYFPLNIGSSFMHRINSCNSNCNLRYWEAANSQHNLSSLLTFYNPLTMQSNYK